MDFKKNEYKKKEFLKAGNFLRTPWSKLPE